MSFLTNNLKQTITLWKQSSVKDAFGNLTYQAPKIIKGRWEEGSDLKFDIEGRDAIAKVVVFLKEDVSLGDFLSLGAETTSSPEGVSGASEVRHFRKTPELRGRNFERMAVL